MIEQYIYSRSEREFTNVLNQTIPLGFGFMALSSGMDNTLKQDVKVHCEDCPRLFHADGRSVPMRFFRKARLPKGQVLLQESTWIEKGARDFHVAHGYVLDGPAMIAGPAKWLAAEFRLEDPNGIPGGIPPLESLSELPGQELPEFRPLRDAALGLGMESYCQLLLACFDALAARRQVLIAWDFEQPGEWELRRSVLYWIYTFLPYDLWSGLGFDGVYTDKSSPGLTHLAFVDRALLLDRGKTPGIQMGNQLLTLGGNFLVRDGEITHNDGKYKTEWYGRSFPYAAWLKRLVEMAWNSPKERRDDVLQTLEDAREKLQHGMRSVPEAKRLNAETYNRVCEQARMLLGRKETAVPAKHDLSKVASKSAEVKPEPSMAVTRSPKTAPEPVVVKPAPQKVTSAPPKDRPAAVPAKEHRQSPSEVYQGIFKRRMWRTREDLTALASMHREVADAVGLLSAFMAWDVDASNVSQLTDVLDCYQRLTGDVVYPQLLPRLFWDGLTDRERAIWNSCGVKSGNKAAEQRRANFYSAIAWRYNMTRDFTVYVRGVLYSLPGFSVEQRNHMERECFQWMDRCFQHMFGEILSRSTIPANPNDIQYLVSVSSGWGWAMAAALGILGAFMARDADKLVEYPLWAPKPEKYFSVLTHYQKYMGKNPAVYNWLLSRLFWNRNWNRMSDVERYAWNKCDVKNSDDAAKKRRSRWYQDISRYIPPESAASYAEWWVGTVSDISGQERAQMVNELQSVVKARRASVNGGSGV